MKRFQPSTISSFIKLSLILPPKMPKRCYIPVSSCPNKCQMVYLVGVLDIRMVNWVSINQQTLHNLKNCFKNYLDKLESCSLSLAKIVRQLEKKYMYQRRWWRWWQMPAWSTKHNTNYPRAPFVCYQRKHYFPIYVCSAIRRKWGILQHLPNRGLKGLTRSESNPWRWQSGTNGWVGCYQVDVVADKDIESSRDGGH